MSASDHSSQANSNKNDALVQRIKAILDRTSPASWVKSGESLNPSIRYDKPRQTWESVFSTKISAGVLVIRCSTPINSTFLGKGFQYQPAGRDNFFVELRGAGWNPTELTDPYKRQETSDRRCEVLATGPLAYQIFAYVKDTFEAYVKSQMTEFSKDAQEVVESVLAIMRKDPEQLGTWEVRRNNPNEIAYINFMGDFCIEGCRCYNGRQEVLFIRVERNGLVSVIEDLSTAHELLTMVIDQEQSTRLDVLSKVLEEI